jgi:nicotinamidase-related amidase
MCKTVAMPSTTQKTALLVMDVQREIVERLGDERLLERVAAALAAARAAAIPVIFVRVAFRPGHPEVSSRNRTFAALRDAGRLSDGESTAVHPAVEPRPGEPVVTKRRVSAFAGSDLDTILRAGEITELVLCGIATSGVVLSTLRAAADLDYALTVLHDACADGDAEIHRVLTEKVFPRQADVLEVGAWAERLASPE